jgi:hypothetical protein
MLYCRSPIEFVWNTRAIYLLPKETIRWLNNPNPYLKSLCLSNQHPKSGAGG